MTSAGTQTPFIEAGFHIPPPPDRGGQSLVGYDRLTEGTGGGEHERAHWQRPAHGG